MAGGNKVPTIERFFEQVSKVASGCWEWQGSLNRDGYGLFRLEGRKMSAHRASWLMFRGPLASREVDVCHKCDNRRCVRPLHLFTGSAKENIADCIAKGRFALGERSGSSKLTDEQVRFIRAADLPLSELASMFSVSKVTCGHVKQGKTWKHI